MSWTAPELLSVESDRHKPSIPSDFYALGMVIYEVQLARFVVLAQNGSQIPVLGADRCSAIRGPAGTGVGMQSRP